MAEILSIIWRVKFINKKEFAKAALYKNVKVFMVYLAFLNLDIEILIYLV